MRSIRTYLPQVVFFVVLALWIPARLGVAFLDSVVLGAYACLGVVFSAPAAAGVSVARAVSLGLMFSWAALVAGVAVVSFERPVVVGPDLRTLAECAAFGVALNVAAAAVVAYAAGRWGPGVARMLARLLLLGLLAVFYFHSQGLPEAALPGAAVAAGIAAAFLALGRRSGHA